MQDREDQRDLDHRVAERGGSGARPHQPVRPAGQRPESVRDPRAPTGGAGRGGRRAGICRGWQGTACTCHGRSACPAAAQAPKVSAGGETWGGMGGHCRRAGREPVRHLTADRNRQRAGRAGGPQPPALGTGLASPLQRGVPGPGQGGPVRHGAGPGGAVRRVAPG
jgi:hypothetical protein